MSEPKVTVVVFNRNGKELISECLESLMKQSYKDFDVIFFDDGSIDVSVEFVKKNFPKVKIMHVYPHVGIAAAQQMAYSTVKSPYIASLHIDAVPDKNWLKELLKVLNKSDENVACAQSIVYQDGQILDGSTNILSANVIYLHTKNKEKFYAGTAAMILKNGLTKNYCDPDYYFYLEDMYLGWVLRLLGYKVVRAFKSFVKHKGTHSAKNQKTRELYQFYNERNRLLNIFTFYEGITLVKIFPVLILGIFLKTVNNLAKEPWKVKSHFKSYFWILRNFETVMRKRRKIQAMRKVKDRQIIKCLSCKLVKENNSKGKILNKFVEIYCKLIGLKTLETS